MQRSQLRQRMIENFNASRVQCHRHSRYMKITPEILFDLLCGVSGKHRPEASRLLNHLGATRWYIQSTAHEGGSKPDAPLHITVMAPRGVHLNCRPGNDGALHVYEITWD